MSRTLSFTTPFPNTLLDEAMPRLKDTEWRLLCVIVRQTLGHYDHAAKARKQRDWLTREQLKARTGRDSEALAKAIDTLVLQNYIIAETQAGEVLATPAARRRNQSRIYYALSPHLRHRKLPAEPNTAPPISEHALPHSRPAASSLYRSPARKSELTGAGKANMTKETLTKETLTKETVTKEKSSKKLKENSYILQKQTQAPAQSQAPAFQSSNNFPESTRPESTQQVFQAEAAGYARHSRHSSYSNRATDFIAVFTDTAKERLGKPVSLHLSPQNRTRLETLLTKHEGQDWEPVMELFFASDFNRIRQQEYSLLAFLDTCNLFLLRCPRRCSRAL